MTLTAHIRLAEEVTARICPVLLCRPRPGRRSPDPHDQAHRIERRAIAATTASSEAGRGWYEEGGTAESYAASQIVPWLAVTAAGIVEVLLSQDIVMGHAAPTPGEEGGLEAWAVHIGRALLARDDRVALHIRAHTRAAK
ncbi:hypothetical protein G7Z17_g7705 [Cylindrodendrum hubeiense]|uniref:Uncharacterized protein n=1 Tax=Cylindrodendrum hubeiense TaxID=595255 RepID=A0A9P5H8K7_9HYPO|nr:hypothetical protein G7Z17_g7705 [Cylindrodendrum hubeiense]